MGNLLRPTMHHEWSRLAQAFEGEAKAEECGTRRAQDAGGEAGEHDS
jgi:hypothetical protein